MLTKEQELKELLEVLGINDTIFDELIDEMKAEKQRFLDYRQSRIEVRDGKRNRYTRGALSAYDNIISKLQMLKWKQRTLYMLKYHNKDL